MPEVNGLAATRAIRSRLPAETQPVIFGLTAHATTEYRDMCFEAGKSLPSPVSLPPCYLLPTNCLSVLFLDRWITGRRQCEAAAIQAKAVTFSCGTRTKLRNNLHSRPSSPLSDRRGLLSDIFHLEPSSRVCQQLHGIPTPFLIEVDPAKTVASPSRHQLREWQVLLAHTT